MRVTYQSQNYQPELVTGRYVRCQGKKGNYSFKVFEVATCWRKGAFYGMAAMGYTLREYVTDGAEIPDEIRWKAAESKTTEKWD